MAFASRLSALIRGWIRAGAGTGRLTLVTLVAALAVSLIILGGLLQATMAANQVTQDNERRLLDNHLSVLLRTQLSAQAVQVAWDDAMRAAGGQGDPLDRKWADVYLGQFLSTMLKADRLFLVAPDGTLLRAWHDGRAADPGFYGAIAPAVRAKLADMASNRTLNGVPAGYRQLQDARWPLDERGHPLTRWSGSIVRAGDRAALMTVVALTPDGDTSLLRRTPNHLVALRSFNAGLVAEIGSAVLLDHMRFSSSPPVAPGNALELSGADGKPLGWMTWRPGNIGAMVLRRTMPLLAGGLLFLAALLVVGGIAVRRALQIARELAASEAQAHHFALHDPMLGLPNRAHVMQRLRGMLAAADEDGLPAPPGEPAQSEVLLAYFDLDHFKSINESIGHHVGDDLLVQIVGRLRERMGAEDMLGRLASDEFVLLRPGQAGAEAADALGRMVMEVFAEPFIVFGHSVPVSASCGISWGPDHGADAKDLLRSADIALFRAKQRGRARYRWFTRDMDATVRWRLDMEVELRRAIALDQLTMVYQPIVNVADGSIASFEALLRWHHRDRGEIGPGIFVPVAEQAGLMPLLGDWVLRRVFADSHDFGKAEISVNLSPLQLVARDFLPHLKSLIADEAVDPARFAFEITEGVLLDRSDKVMDLITELQDMGFRIALDDFGTGYSSLAYLRSFPFDRIKIDRAFVQGIESDVDAQSILRAIVALGRTLRMKVVAEGVETLLQQQLVQAAGCQLIQGHLYWRALTPEQVIGLLATDCIQDMRIAV